MDYQGAKVTNPPASGRRIASFPPQPVDTKLSRWRRTHSELRALERRLVDLAGTAEPVQLDELYREIAALRVLNRQLFEAAQAESQHLHFMTHSWVTSNRLARLPG